MPVWCCRQIEVFISIIITCLSLTTNEELGGKVKALYWLACYKSVARSRGQGAQHNPALQIAWLAAMVKCTENSFCHVSGYKERFMHCTSELHREGQGDTGAIWGKEPDVKRRHLHFPLKQDRFKCEIRHEMATAKPEPETHYIHAGVSGRVQQGTMHTDYLLKTTLQNTKATMKFGANNMRNNKNLHHWTV